MAAIIFHNVESITDFIPVVNEIMKRREFIRNSMRQAAAVAVPAAGVAIASGSELYEQLSARLASTADSLQSSLRDVTASIGEMTGRVDLLELRFRIVTALLMISMLVDGGFAWMLISAPVPVIA